MELFSPLAVGVVFGLSAGFAPGPLLTFVVTQTIKHNVKEGLKVAVTPLITDLPIILVSMFILSRISDFSLILGVISLSGSIYILYMSYDCIRTKPVELSIHQGLPNSLKKGSLINALNPHPYLFWIMVGSPLILRFYDDNPLSSSIFILCFYLFLVGSKMFLAVIAGKSRVFLTSKGYLFTMRLLGVLLAVFAFMLIKDAVVFLDIF